MSKREFNRGYLMGIRVALLQVKSKKQRHNLIELHDEVALCYKEPRALDIPGMRAGLIRRYGSVK